MFCTNCGKEIDEKAVACPHCGVATKNMTVVNDNGGFGWGVLGFFVPVAGLILFLIWKQERPKTAKAAGIGALCSVACYVLFFILYFVFIFSLLGGLFWSY